MGTLIGLGVGVGLMLIWSSFFVPMPQRNAQRAPGRIEQLLARAGMSQVSVTSFVVLSIATAAVIGVLIQAISHTVTVAAVFAAMAGCIPYVIVSGRARKRQREFAAVWPEAIDNLASAVRAGLALPDALAALAVRGPVPLRSAFDAFALDYQVSGRFGESLDRLKHTLADPVGDRVVEGLRIAREVGGGELGRLLRNLSGYLRDELHTRQEVEARQSWAVNGARLAVAAPWLILLMMSFQTQAIQRYASPTGAMLLLFGAGICLFAYRMMLRIGRLPSEKRVLG